MSRTAVVILNWNNRNFLEEFLPDVIKYSSEVAEIIVADNASTDDSVSFLKKNFPSVKIICNPTNEGFAGGYNLALKNVNADYFMLLNSDVKVSENWLVPLIEILDKNKNAGAVQPKILSNHSPELFEYAGAAGGFIDKYGYPFCRGRMFNTIETDHHQYDDTRPVFWATGACMLVRSKVFNVLEGFDSLFFAHMEEIDLCWRIQKIDYQIYYCGSSFVFHVGGGSLPKSNPHKTYLNFRNNLLMLYKNADPAILKTVLFVRFFLDAIASLSFLLAGNFGDYRAVWRARSDFNKLKVHYPRLARNTLVSGQNKSIFIYHKSIVFDYYICSIKKFSSLVWKNS